MEYTSLVKECKLRSEKFRKDVRIPSIHYLMHDSGENRMDGVIKSREDASLSFNRFALISMQFYYPHLIVRLKITLPFSPVNGRIKPVNRRRQWCGPNGLHAHHCCMSLFLKPIKPIIYKTSATIVSMKKVNAV